MGRARWAGAVVLGAGRCAAVPIGNRNTYRIQSSGMATTLQVNDIVAGTKNVTTLKCGDIIVFEGPPGAVPTEGFRLVKRVIGVPGETVEGDGAILVNGARPRRVVLPSPRCGPASSRMRPLG